MMDRFRRMDLQRMAPEERDDGRLRSLINNNGSGVMKVLTPVATIMLPNLVASIYGMNVPLPIRNSPFSFYIVLGISTLPAGGSILCFAKKKWF